MIRLFITFFLFMTTSAYAAISVDQIVVSGPPAGSITFSTTQPNDVILLFVGANTEGASGTISISSACGLTWSLRTAQLVGTDGAIGALYWAPAPAIVTNCTVTASFSGTTICNRTLTEWSVTGAYNIYSPFDTDPTFPQTFSSPAWTNFYTPVTTTALDTFVFTFGFGNAGGMQSGQSNIPPPGATSYGLITRSGYSPECSWYGQGGHYGIYGTKLTGGLANSENAPHQYEIIDVIVGSGPPTNKVRTYIIQ